MTGRIYISNISKAWTTDRQREVLASAAIAGKPSVYEDILTRRALQSSDPSFLLERATMLRPTSRRAPETIYVAALAVLARSASDLLDAFAKAAARQATIVSVSEGLTIPPDPHAAILADATRAFETGRRRAQTEGGRLAGAKVSAEKRRAATAAGLDAVREDWGKPSSEVSTAALTQRSGLTYKTLNDHLGPRKKAQHQQLLREQRAARGAEGRTR